MSIILHTIANDMVKDVIYKNQDVRMVHNNNLITTMVNGVLKIYQEHLVIKNTYIEYNPTEYIDVSSVKCVKIIPGKQLIILHAYKENLKMHLIMKKKFEYTIDENGDISSVYNVVSPVSIIYT